VSPPHRATPEGRAYLDLQARAKEDGRTTQEYLQLYCLEGFLARLVASVHTEQLVLKGGVLLAAYALRRPTADVDLAARNQSNGTEEVRRLVADIAAAPLTGDADDGLTYDSHGARAETIREDDAYSGVRVTMKATLATANLYFNVDVNVGDPIWPAPVDVSLPKLLGGSIDLLGYPIPMVVAEKAVTAMQRGTASTRWRDFGDLYQLTGTHAMTAGDVRSAIHEVAVHRRVEPEPLEALLDGYDVIGQAKYRAWRRRTALDDRLPEDFGVLVNAVYRLVDPLLDGNVHDAATWEPKERVWKSPGPPRTPIGR
jgi:hypothetical protein